MECVGNVVHCGRLKRSRLKFTTSRAPRVLSCCSTILSASSLRVCLCVTSCSAGRVRQCTSHCPARQGIMPAGPSRYVCLSRCLSVSVFVCLHVTSCSAGHVRQCTSHCPAHQGIMPAGPSRYVCLSHCLSVHLSVCFTKRGYVVCAVWEVIPTDFSRLYVAVCVRVSE